MEDRGGKRYFSLKAYFSSRYPFRVHRIPVHAGFSCPNRDGTISTQGCLFCNNGAFNPYASKEPYASKGTDASGGDCDVDTQIISGMAFARRRFKANRFIVYFQTFTNTYGTQRVLKEAYDRILKFPDVIGLSVGTRPDCIDEEKLDLLRRYTGLSEIWVELGIQTAHDRTLERMNRGHGFAAAVKAVHLAKEKGLDVIAHIILGLPGETKKDMRHTAQQLSRLPLDGIKIHNLHVVSGTPLADWYRRGRLKPLEQAEYVEAVCDFLEYLPSTMVIHRLVGEADPSLLIAPGWSMEKQKILEDIDRELARRDVRQGCRYRE